MKKVLIFLLVMIITVTPVITLAEEYEIPEGVLDYNYHVACITPDNYWVLCFNEPDQVKVRTNDNGKVFIYWENRNNGYVYKKSLSTGVWSENLPNEGEIMISNIVGSNTNVKHRDGYVFFSPPATPVLFQEMKKVQSGMILKNILVGLTPLVGLIVSVICFKKGWDFLRSQLTH